MLVEMNMDSNCNVTFKLDPSVAVDVGNEFYRVAQQYMKMAKWFDNKDVPKEQKDKLRDVYIKGMAEMNFLYQFLQHCGYCKEEISDMANLPF